MTYHIKHDCKKSTGKHMVLFLPIEMKRNGIEWNAVFLSCPALDVTPTKTPVKQAQTNCCRAVSNRTEHYKVGEEGNERTHKWCYHFPTMPRATLSGIETNCKGSKSRLLLLLLLIMHCTSIVCSPNPNLRLFVIYVDTTRWTTSNGPILG